MPQQNGVAERMNITLMDTAAYLINTSPSKAIKKKTPIEMWSGHPSDYEMLSIFCCVAYLHDKHGKLKPRVIKCVLLRYPKLVKRELRTRMKPLRFRDESNMVAYAFVAAGEEDTHKPLTYHEAVACEDSSK
nr:retrotransposon protein, putative, Ty1-copia subclass [Tanacetum cinerariifolium]